MLRTCSFFFVEIFNFRVTGMGINRTAISNTMLIIAAAHPMALILTHFPFPGPRHRFQAYGIGVHWNVKAKVNIIIYRKQKAITKYTARRNSLCEKTLT